MHFLSVHIYSLHAVPLKVVFQYYPPPYFKQCSRSFTIFLNSATLFLVAIQFYDSLILDTYNEVVPSRKVSIS